jgi:hypothetical protein
VAAESRRHHASDGELGTAHDDAPADDLGIGAEARRPECMAQNGGRGTSSEVVVARLNGAPELRTGPQDVEISSRHEHRVGRDLIRVDDDRRRCALPCGGARRGADVRADGLEGHIRRRRHPGAAADVAGGVESQGEDAGRIGDVRGGAEQRAIDEAEHRKVQSYGDREHDDGPHDGPGRRPQRAEGRADVDPEAFNHGPLDDAGRRMAGVDDRCTRSVSATPR